MQIAAHTGPNFSNFTEHLDGISTKQQVKIQGPSSHNQHIYHGSAAGCHVNSNSATTAADLFRSN